MRIDFKNKPIVRSRRTIIEKNLGNEVRHVTAKSAEEKNEPKKINRKPKAERKKKLASAVVSKEYLRYKRMFQLLNRHKDCKQVEKKENKPIIKLPTKNKPSVKKQVNPQVDTKKNSRNEIKNNQTKKMLPSSKFGKNAHRAVIGDRDEARLITLNNSENVKRSILSDYKTSNKNRITSSKEMKSIPSVKIEKKITSPAEVIPGGRKSLIDFICEADCKSYTSDTSGIIVTMTSWPKRIKNVAKTLKTILDNNVLPEKIIVNLSTDEFPGKESNLPNELVLLSQKNPIIEFHWLKHNTTVWKKIIPTIVRFKNANVICIDDDRLYPKNFIATFKEAASKYPSGPITGANISFHKKFKQHCGHATLDKYAFYKDGLDFITRDVMDLKSSDSVLTIIANRTGHQTQYLGTNYLSLIPQNNNPVDGYSSNGKISVSTAIKSADTLFDRYISSQKKEEEKIDVKIYTENYGDFEITYAEIL